MAEILYQLNKGENYDVDGRILNSYMHYNLASEQYVRIEDITNMGTITNLVYLFYSHPNIKIVNLTDFNTSRVKNTAYAFSSSRNLISVSNFNTSNVKDMSCMFQYCPNLIEVPNFNTNKVTNMAYMLEYSSNLITVPNFNTSKVINTVDMFMGCSNLREIPQFDTGNVINMKRMFYTCKNLIEVPMLNLNKVKDIQGLFYLCDNLSYNSYNNITNFLPLAANLNNQYLSNININLAKFSRDQLNILWNKGYLDAEYIGDYKIVYSINAVEPYITQAAQIDKRGEDLISLRFLLNNIPNKEIRILSIQNIGGSYELNMESMFQNYTNLREIQELSNTINIRSMKNMFTNCQNLISICNFDTSNVTNMSRMFENCKNLTSISNFDTSNVTNMERMFLNCHDLTVLPSLDTSKVQTVEYLFYNCGNLTSIPNYNFSNVHSDSLYGLFFNCGVLSENDIKQCMQTMTNYTFTSKASPYSTTFYNTLITDSTVISNELIKNCSNISFTFTRCQALTNIDSLKDWDIQKINLMTSLFSECKMLNNFNSIANWQMNNITATNGMFFGCSNLLNVDFMQNWNLTNVQNAQCMFANCRNITNLNHFFNIINMNTIDLRGAFCNCYALEGEINLVNLNTSNYVNFVGTYTAGPFGYGGQAMFEDCRSVTKINMSNLNTTNINSLSYLFYNCYNLKEIDISNWNCNKIASLYSTFFNCHNIINIPYINSNNISNMSNFIYNATCLSQSSVNNIVKLCANSSKISNKNWINIGFSLNYTVNNAPNYNNWIRMAPDYSNAVAAGWTNLGDPLVDDPYAGMTNSEKAIAMVQDYWGGTDGYGFSIVNTISDTRYVVAVTDNSTTEQFYYTVDTETGTVEEY